MHFYALFIYTVPTGYTELVEKQNKEFYQGF